MSADQNIDDPKISRALAQMVNTKLFAKLSDDDLLKWKKSLKTAKTIRDLPQDILKKLGWKNPE